MEFPKVGDVFKQINYRPDILGFDTFYTAKVVAIFDPRLSGAEGEFDDYDVTFVVEFNYGDSRRYQPCNFPVMSQFMKDYNSQKQDIIKRYEKDLKYAREEFYNAQAALKRAEDAYNTIMKNSVENV